MACLKSVYFSKAPHLRIKIWKTCIGMSEYPNVIYFKESVPEKFPEELVEMLEAAYNLGLSDKEHQIGSKMREIKTMVNILCNL